MNPPTSTWRRLTPEMLSAFRRRDENLPKRNTVLGAIRTRFGYGVSQHQWSHMKRGDPVSCELIDRLAAILGRDPNSIATVCDPPARNNAPCARVNAWKGEWLDIARVYLQRVIPPDLSFWHHPGDALIFSRMAIEHAGRNLGKKPNLKMSEAEAIECGTRHVGQTPEEFSAWLTPIWTKHQDVALFACAQTRHGAVERVGNSCVCPVSKTFADDFLGGKAEYYDLTPGEIEYGSSYAFIPIAGESYDKNLKAANRVSQAHMLNIMYQTAAMCRPDAESNITWLSFAGLPQSRARLEAKGFTAVGTVTPIQKRDVMRYTRPNRHPALLQYIAMMGIVNSIRAAIDAGETDDE